MLAVCQLYCSLFDCPSTVAWLLTVKELTYQISDYMLEKLNNEGKVVKSYLFDQASVAIHYRYS